MSEIDFYFATRDDCLQRMVPSDLRAIISERDKLREEKNELLKALDEVTDFWCVGAEAPSPEELEPYVKIIAKAKGEQG